RVTHHFPILVPSAGTSLFGGGAFDGSALWVGHSRFQPGQAPAIGADSPSAAGSPPNTGTIWNGGICSAESSSAARVTDEYLLDTRVVQHFETRKAFLIAAHWYVPKHSGDAPTYSVRLQPYLERDTRALTGNNGMGTQASSC